MARLSNWVIGFKLEYMVRLLMLTGDFWELQSPHLKISEVKKCWPSVQELTFKAILSLGVNQILSLNIPFLMQ